MFRSGFTSELGLGIAHTSVSNEGGGGVSKIGLAPLSFSLGGFVTPDLAIMGRAAGTSFFGEDRNGKLVQTGNLFYGVVMQGWLSESFFVGGGVGYMIYGLNPLISPNARMVAGWGLTARGGWSFASTRHHSFDLVLELFPSFYDGAKVFGTALNLEWQYF